jgi:hypothetical protein
MRRTISLAFGTAALAVAVLAVAQLQGTGTQAVSATFTATSLVRSDTRTCTGSDGTYEITHARYNGTATSATAGLAGPIQIRVKSVYNTTERLGWVDGTLHIRGDERRAAARLSAVNSNGVLDGFVQGHLNRRYAVLRASFTVGYTRTGGFTGGQLGTGSATNTGLLAGQVCRGRTPRASVRLVVRGDVESISPRTNGIDAGDDVEVTCALVSGALTLVKIRRR